MTRERQAKAWAAMNADERAEAVDTLKALFAATLGVLCEDINEDLERRGVPFKMSLTIEVEQR